MCTRRRCVRFSPKHWDIDMQGNVLEWCLDGYDSNTKTVPAGRSARPSHASVGDPCGRWNYHTF